MNRELKFVIIIFIFLITQYCVFSEKLTVLMFNRTDNYNSHKYQFRIDIEMSPDGLIKDYNRFYFDQAKQDDVLDESFKVKSSESEIEKYVLKDGEYKLDQVFQIFNKNEIIIHMPTTQNSAKMFVKKQAPDKNIYDYLYNDRIILTFDLSRKIPKLMIHSTNQTLIYNYDSQNQFDGIESSSPKGWSEYAKAGPIYPGKAYYLIRYDPDGLVIASYRIEGWPRRYSDTILIVNVMMLSQYNERRLLLPFLGAGEEKQGVKS